MSYNNLSVMPSGPQLQTLNNQIYIYVGNPGICGPPLLKNCSINGAKQTSLSLALSTPLNEVSIRDVPIDALGLPTNGSGRPHSGRPPALATRPAVLPLQLGDSPLRPALAPAFVWIWGCGPHQGPAFKGISASTLSSLGTGVAFPPPIRCPGQD
uniref:Uncharacterized protein n=1 Tax=Oryza barthii TaxID=65489 RepID=A0A0D3EQX5_9ORYZ